MPELPPTIPNLVRQAAEQFTTRDYVVTPDRRLTFAEADAQSRRLAKRLLRSGVGKGARVGICFPQGPDFVVALLAVTRIGAVVVPLSTFLRGPELHRAVRHADVELLIAPRDLLGQRTEALFESVWPDLARASAREVHLLEVPYLRSVWICGGSESPWATATPVLGDLADEPEIDDVLLDAVESEVTPSDLVVMIFTSGATADPKAVVHTHGAQVRHSGAIARLHGITHETRSFTTMPFFWAGGLTVSLLSHLHVGATVITVERTDASVMLELIERTNPTRLLGWTLVERIMAAPELADRDLTWLLDLQLPSLARPGRRHSSLGMTETGGPHTGVPEQENTVDLPDDLRGSFGRPLPGVEHTITDPATGRPLPDGVDGEICVRGYNVMDGLYKRERSETFDEDGWYHTGDAGFFRDGLLFFTGRLTEMIKTGGANVSPREVETVVESLAGVKAAFVVGLPDPARGELVGCLVCAESGSDLDPAALTERLRDELSSYKVPKRMMVVPYDDAPWLPSGKVSKPRIVEMLVAGRTEGA
jgi:acyl-CoA synthetase (AMP-forming)/AMP-acid ligase II